MSDALFYQTDNGGELEILDGVVTMDGGLRSAVYLSLFGGPEDNSAWWGGLGLTGHLQALTRGVPLISGNLARIQDAAAQDLEWLKSERVANVVQVQAAIVRHDVLQLTVRIGAYGEESEFRFTEVWGASRDVTLPGTRPPAQLNPLRITEDRDLREIEERALREIGVGGPPLHELPATRVTEDDATRVTEDDATRVTGEKPT